MPNRFVKRESQMPKYLLIESRDPLEYGKVPCFYELATGLAREQHTVTFFLVQNGVLPAAANRPRCWNSRRKPASRSSPTTSPCVSAALGQLWPVRGRARCR